MSARLRWGILSTAHVAETWIPRLRRSRRSILTAVASREPDRARAFATKWNIPLVLPTYQALIESAEVDAVYLPLPHALHAEWVVRAVQAGKHVLCEKPLAQTCAEVDRIASAAEAARVVVQEALVFRLHPQLAAVKRTIRAGAIGQPFLIRASFTTPRLETPDDFRFSARLGGGSLRDLGVYPIGLTLAIQKAAPRDVAASARLTADGVDLRTTAMVTFEGAVTAQIDCGFGLPLRMAAEIVGEAGILRIPQPWLPDVEGPNGFSVTSPDGATSTWHEEEAVDPIECGIQAVERAALDGIASPYPLAESRRGIELLERIARAAGLENDSIPGTTENRTGETA